MLMLDSICFIHGLGGGRASTWTKDDVFWPRVLLANDIPNARILTWGYDADFAHFWSAISNNKVDDHASNLLQDLGGFREST